MNSLHSRLRVELGRKNEIFYHSEKEHPQISRIAKFGWRNVVKCGKCSLTKFLNFAYICITRGKSYHF